MKNAILLIFAIIFFMTGEIFASSVITQRVVNAHGFVKGSTTIRLSGQLSDSAMSSIKNGYSVEVYNYLDSYLVFPTLLNSTKAGFGIKSETKNISVNTKNGKFKWTDKDVTPYFAFVTGRIRGGSVPANFSFAKATVRTKPDKAFLQSKGILRTSGFARLNSKRLTILDSWCAGEGLGYVASEYLYPKKKGNSYKISRKGDNLQAKVSINPKGKITAQYKLSYEIAYPAILENENLITNEYDYSLVIVGDGNVSSSFVGPDQVEFKVTRNRNKFRYFYYNGIRVTNNFLRLDLDEDTEVQAVFGTYNLSVKISGKGSVKHEFVGPDEVIATAISDDDSFYSFKWDENVSYVNPVRFTMTSDTELLATFKTVTSPPSTDGTYMVIDLSGGTSADSYPISYLDGVPEGGWSDEYKTTKMVLRKVKAGKFAMGSPEDELGRHPTTEVQHGVTLTKDYFIGVFETTQKQYELIVGNNPAHYKGNMRPVECVSYDMIRGAEKGTNWPANNEVDANSFLGILRAKTNKAFDLPTEAQWEYACRAGSTTSLNNGNNLTNMYEDGSLNKLARNYYNHNDGKGDYNEHTTVGSYLPNAWGLYDMHGNIYEWCLDWYSEYNGDVTDPKGNEEGDWRILRGGSFDSQTVECRSANRNSQFPSINCYDFEGFRVVLESENSSTSSDDTYLVIDLSDGTNAESYPISYLDDVPEGGWSDEYKTTKMVLRKIKAGEFTMGSPAGELGRYSDEVQHEVTLTEDYYIGIFETTQKQYELIVGNNPAYYQGSMRPVECVSYDKIRGNEKGAFWPANGTVDATSFLGILRAKTSKRFDLPTEAQWEYACRAGTTTSLNDGNNITNMVTDGNLNKLGRYYRNRDDGKGGYTNATATVGSYFPNGWGLYDMHGNVSEWCLDWIGSYEGNATDPKGATEGYNRILRGGYFYSYPYSCRSAYRIASAPFSESVDYGFRIVLNTSSNKFNYSLKIVGDGDVDHGYVGNNQVEFRVTRNKDKFRYYSYDGIKVTNDFLTLELESDTTVTAVFGTYNLDVKVSGKGFLSCEFVGPDEVIATAIPGEESFYNFEWNGNVSYNNPVTFIMTGDTELLATFKKGISPPPNDGIYMVIDLSGGTSADSYPISYLKDVPTGGWPDEFKTTKMVLRKVKAGRFTMGSPEEDLFRLYDEGQHEVTLTKDFYIGVFETTQRQYELIAGNNPAYYQGSMRPVERVSYDKIRGKNKGAKWPANSEVDATSFLGILRVKANKGFDLPTEAQWEFACRAGTTTALNDGNNLTNSYEDGNMNKLGRYYYNSSDGKGDYNYSHTTVGSYLPNAWGLYDMHGNVAEWCLDWYQYNLGSYPVTDPKGNPEGSYRLFRGGYYNSDARYCRSAYRSCRNSSYYYASTGFRVVLESDSTSTNIYNYKYSLKIVGDGDVDHGYVGTNKAEFKVTRNKDKFRYYSYNGIKVTNDSMTLNLTEDTEVTAVFGSYDFSLEVIGNGSASAEFTGSDEVKIKVTNGASRFRYYTVNGEKYTNSEISLKLIEDTEATAVFGNYNFNVKVSGNGSVNYEFIGPDEVKVTAVPGDDPFYSFEWNGNVSKNNPQIITLTSDTELLATFKKAGDNNYKYSLKIVGDGDVDHGYVGTNKAEFKVTRNKDKFRYYSYNGIKVANDSMTLNLTEDTEVTAVFGSYDFSLEVIGNGSASAEFTGPDEVKIKVTNGASRFRYYTVNWKKYTDSEITLKLTEDTKVTAVFGAYDFSLIISGNGSASAEFTGPDEVKIKATNGAARFRYYSVNDKRYTESDITLELTEDTEVTAVFGNYTFSVEVSGKGSVSYEFIGPDEVKVTAIPDGEAFFSFEWDGNVSKNNPQIITMYRDTKLLATFKKTGDNTYMVIDLSAGPAAESYPITYLDDIPAGGWTDEYKTTKMVLRKIKAGKFNMGSLDDELGRGTNEKYHEVTLTKDFYIGVFEMTQKQYMLIKGTNPSKHKGDARPVDYISYNDIRGKDKGSGWPENSEVDATSFLGILRARTGKTFDLPTEAQWEYACRAGKPTSLNSGWTLSDIHKCDEMAEVGRYYYNTDDGKGGYSDHHTTVGSYLPNAWGLYDMHGNVFEWCLDLYAADLGSDPVTDPKGANKGSTRITRSGSYDRHALQCRSAFRLQLAPYGTSVYAEYGFRIVLVL